MGEATPEGVTAKVDKTWPVSCCNIDNTNIVMSFNCVLNRVCAERISEAQGGFIRGCSIAASVALTEAATSTLALIRNYIALRNVPALDMQPGRQNTAATP